MTCTRAFLGANCDLDGKAVLPEECPPPHPHPPSFLGALSYRKRLFPRCPCSSLPRARFANTYGTPRTSQVALLVKNSPASAGDVRDMGLNSLVGKIPWKHGNPLQYSCLRDFMDREVWQAIVHGVAKS